MASLRRFIRKLKKRLEDSHRIRRYPVGSAEWLVGIEGMYGGVVWTKTRSVNPLDPRLKKRRLESLGERGGDRMSQQFHGYAKLYQSYLESFVRCRHDKLTICEIGILQGTGLAVWCDLFPQARIIGLDIDLSYFKENYHSLKKLGAFSKNSPEVYCFDQYDRKIDESLQNILNGDKVDICIDDACHADDAILMTLKCFSPHLNKRFVYFVEDNKFIHNEIRIVYKNFSVEMYDIGSGLTVVSN